MQNYHKHVTFWITCTSYGGDVDSIEQAAKACSAQLIEVKGDAREDYPGDRASVEGDVHSLFRGERTAAFLLDIARYEACDVVHEAIRAHAGKNWRSRRTKRDYQECTLGGVS